jgi:two-component system, sensor histidine kinase
MENKAGALHQDSRSSSERETDLRVRIELVDLLFAGSKVAVATTFIGPVLVAWLFHPLLGTPLAVLPALGILCLHAERAWHIMRFQRARQRPGYAPEPWAQGTQWRLAVMGVAISLWVLAVMVTRDASGIFYSVALVVVLAAASLQYSVYPRTVDFYLTPLLLGCCAQLLWIGPGYVVPAFFVFVTWLTLIAASRRFGRTMRSNIELRLRNEQLNHELMAQKAILEEVSASKTRFLTAASHDLRQPVQSVMLLSEALQERAESSANRELLGKLRTGVDHFANAVDEIMDIAQLDAGTVPVHPQTVRVSDLLLRLDSTYRQVAEAKQLGFFLRPPADPDAAVVVDPVLAWRILSNLVSNAIRYTARGQVMIAVRPQSTLTGQGESPGPALRFEVRDSGIGIHPMLQQRVFEEFFQVENLHRDRKKGVGLGLAVARRLARLMGLPLTMRSQSGKGSVFALAMPLSPVPAEPVVVQPADLTTHEGLCLFVVDDDREALDATLALLASWGVVARGAATLDDLVTSMPRWLTEGARPHGLLTDHWLPDGHSSSDVDAQVRRLLHDHCPEQAQALQTAVFTGDSRPQTRATIEGRGWAFWQKPVRPQQLRQWLASLPRPEPPVAEPEPIGSFAQPEAR